MLSKKSASTDESLELAVAEFACVEVRYREKVKVCQVLKTVHWHLPVHSSSFSHFKIVPS